MKFDFDSNDDRALTIAALRDKAATCRAIADTVIAGIDMTADGERAAKARLLREAQDADRIADMIAEDSI